MRSARCGVCGRKFSKAVLPPISLFPKLRLCSQCPGQGCWGRAPDLLPCFWSNGHVTQPQVCALQMAAGGQGDCWLLLESGRDWMGWPSTNRSLPGMLASPFTRPQLLHGYHFHVRVKQLVGLKRNYRVRTTHSKYLFPKTVCWAPGQKAGLMPASDVLESAATGFASLLPWFLVKQLKSSIICDCTDTKGWQVCQNTSRVLCLWAWQG